jgi:MOSC domain-containing protein YiiM
MTYPVDNPVATSASMENQRLLALDAPFSRSMTTAEAEAEERIGGIMIGGIVTAVSCSAKHTFTKPTTASIRLLAGLGVEGDAHLGVTVKHRVRVRTDPHSPNLRQVHLSHAELFEELRAAGFAIAAGQIGENVTTRGIDLLSLPTGTRLHLGAAAVVEVTGLRNPCRQLDAFQAGLTAALIGRDPNGKLIRKAGIILAGGEVRPGDPIEIELPPPPHQPMERV